VLLRHESLQPAWAFLFRLPLVPWTSFNNTVVLGSFTLGLTMFLPTYVFSHAAFRRWQSVRTRARSRNAPPDSGDCVSHDSTAAAAADAVGDDVPKIETPSPGPQQVDPSDADWDDTFVEHTVGCAPDANPPFVCRFRIARRSRPTSTAASGDDSMATAEQPTSLPPVRRSA
jgi:hypothetical protein